MKVLCVCVGGNVRSVSLANVLKTKYHYDAIACGIAHVSRETLHMLCTWADKIVVMHRPIQRQIPRPFHHKVAICEVGVDKWHHPFHPELWKLVAEKAVPIFGPQPGK